MNRLVGVLLSGIVMLAGCALFIPKETRYLQSAQGRATQEEVRQQLGTPKQVSTTPTGESQWLYEVREIEAGAQNSWATAGSWCDEYRLTFDNTGVLRQWTHKSFFHGGELAPATCNNRLGVEKPAL